MILSIYNKKIDNNTQYYLILPKMGCGSSANAIRSSTIICNDGQATLVNISSLVKDLIEFNKSNNLSHNKYLTLYNLRIINETSNLEDKYGPITIPQPIKHTNVQFIYKHFTSLINKITYNTDLANLANLCDYINYDLGVQLFASRFAMKLLGKTEIEKTALIESLSHL
jgi:hypothetical protein